MKFGIALCVRKITMEMHIRRKQRFIPRNMNHTLRYNLLNRRSRNQCAELTLMLLMHNHNLFPLPNIFIMTLSSIAAKRMASFIFKGFFAFVCALFNIILLCVLSL